MKKTSIDLILNEHRAFESVLTALREFVDGIAAGRYTADFGLLAAMIEYVTEVPEQVHHHKEDEYLFARLRLRVPDAGPLIDELMQQHARGPKLTAELERALIHYRNAEKAGLDAFHQKVNEYVDFQWQHILKEERELLPLAQERLLADDWAVIDAAFLTNHNPWRGVEDEYAALFEKIVSLAPAPIGLGGSSANQDFRTAN